MRRGWDILCLFYFRYLLVVVVYEEGLGYFVSFILVFLFFILLAVCEEGLGHFLFVLF